MRELMTVPAPGVSDDAHVDVLIVEGTARLAGPVTDAWPGSCEVATAATAAEAAGTAARAGCVLLDLSAARNDGLDAVAMLREAAPDVPLVVLTGPQESLLGAAAVRAGAQDWLIEDRADADALVRALRYAMDRKRAERELAHQALHDALTGLPNRRLLLDRLELAVEHSHRRGTAVAVLRLDIDGFKQVNDLLGHRAGDELIAEMAGRLRSVVRPSDTAARFGGDEFTVLCDDIADERDAATIAERVLAALAAPVDLGEHEVFLGASIGIALANRGEPGAETVLANADAAMHRAKSAGGGRYVLHDELLQARALRRLTLRNDLHRALERGELRVHYQPIVELEALRIVGVEALTRWEHPVQGLVPPADFIPLAEESGLITALGEWVLHEACVQTASWRRRSAEREGLMVSVNVSPRQLADGVLPEHVRSALASSALPAANLCLELTESAVMADEDAVLETLLGLKRLGVTIAIDDFGTGYSSLSHLDRYPIDTLKIDRSFISQLGHDSAGTRIVPAVIGLARALRVQTVAEGVEEPGQRDELRALGCEFAQGYHFARPAPADLVEFDVLKV